MDDLRRALRQHAETARLFGVDFLPVAAPPPRPAPEPKPQEGTTRVATPAAVRTPATPTDPAAKRAALDELRAAYEREAEVPRLIEGWTNIVFEDGDPAARLMFVGEAPGAEEDLQGRPFVGRAGGLLNQMIEAMGLSRETVYIANVLKVRPPNNRTPSPDEAALDGPWLEKQIAVVRPEVIVTLGRPATHYLLRTKEAMGRLRGVWQEYDAIPVMPTYHPAFLLRQYTPENRRSVWSDLKQVMERLGLPGKP